jgi:hypothetical protein
MIRFWVTTGMGLTVDPLNIPYVVEKSSCEDDGNFAMGYPLPVEDGSVNQSRRSQKAADSVVQIMVLGRARKIAGDFPLVKGHGGVKV